MKTRKVLAILIAAVMVFALLPASLFAATINVTNSTELASAISAANDGDTIHLNNGNYTLPATTIAKNLTITGESESGVVINASAPMAVWITVDATLTLKNLTLDGNTQAIQKAIYVSKNKSLTLENLTMKNIKAPSYNGLGVYNFFGNLTVKNVTMSDMGRIGIHTKSTIDVDGFTYTGKGAGDWLDYGIEMGTYGSDGVTILDVPYTAKIENVNISDCLGVASSDGSTSAGIYVNTYFYTTYGGNASLITAIINHANIRNCTTGVAIGYDDTLDEFSSTTVSDSNFFNNKYDLSIAGHDATGSLTLSGNYYGGGAPDTDFDDSVTVIGLSSYVTTPVIMNGGTEVTANADVTYTVIIPSSVDFGTIHKGLTNVSKDFDVSVEDALFEYRYGIKVENTTEATDMVMRDKNGSGSNTLAFMLSKQYYLFDASDLDENGDATQEGTISCNPSQLMAAGSYKGYMTFSVTYGETD